MGDGAPVIMWFRRDLRLADHPALTAACQSGRPVIPVFIRDETVDDLGAAPMFRLGLALESFAATLDDMGSRLILRSGPAAEVLDALIEETGASAVFWSRGYDEPARERDSAIKSDLKARGLVAQSFPGHLMFEPWDVSTKSGGYYKVYSPFWREVSPRDVPDPLPAPEDLSAPDSWPDSESLDDWDMAAAMKRGAEIVRPHCVVGEAEARKRLDDFVDGPITDYKAKRDFPAEPVTSGLSENLTYGEISPATCWHAASKIKGDGAGHFLKELVWREFAYHLIYHTPQITHSNWRSDWDSFPWGEGEKNARVTAWRQGRTGIRFVDAAMREMYVTGTMHNRARMIVASYLTKHLMHHWRIGQKWFEDCLIDWDPASNALGWQWTAGSGPDAAPYFRVFNPVSQLEKFDPDGEYQRRWLAEPYDEPSKTALSYFDAVPERWNLDPEAEYPEPVVTAEEGREAALSAYENRDF